MTAEEFNLKYISHLETGFDGLMIDNPNVTQYLDCVFGAMSKKYKEKFTYSQIKIKFGESRVYLTPNEIPISAIEKTIDFLLKANIRK